MAAEERNSAQPRAARLGRRKPPPTDEAARRIPRVFLLIESSRASGRAMLKGIADYAHHHGPWSFYWETGGLEKAWPVLKELDADGIILRDVDALGAILALGIPAIVVGHQRNEVAGQVNVITDSANIGRLAAEHLLHCGFRHFAFCGLSQTPEEHTPWSAARRESFCQQIQRSGFSKPACFELASMSRNWADERATVARWLGSLPQPVGLFACNDDCGQRVIEACRLAGLPVPDAVGIIGADNDELVCGLSDPAMSSVAIGFERAGYEAAEALDWMMQGSRQVPGQILVRATHVVARRSTDIVAQEDMHLVKALRFLRDHARGAVDVASVARAAGLSRRALERRFRAVLQRSVLDEIRRMRTDQIARLLVETPLPVSAIAESLGYADAQHFARYFRAAKHISPLAYRKQFGVKAGSAVLTQNGGNISQSGVVGAVGE